MNNAMFPFSLETIKQVLADTNPETTESLAQQAASLTRQYFGRAIPLYAPLYISNYCSSQCTYCGFNNHHNIIRKKLSAAEIRQEAQAIANTGIEDLLLLTGESYEVAPLSYLLEAVEICKEFFPHIGLEIHPLEEDEYRELFSAGADSVTIYQETYDRERYKEVHLAGKKRDYDFRYHTPQRAARARMRRISLGILLGLSAVAEDLFALFSHLKYMEKHFPGVDYSLSFPRLRKIKGRDFALCDVDDIAFIKIICLSRIFFPRVGINLSTRETAQLRDHAIELGVTRLSAGSNTSVGGYSLEAPQDQDPQFDIADHRTFDEIYAMLKQKNFDPVLTDWRRIGNEK